MNEKDLYRILDELSEDEQQIFMKIVKAEKELLHRKSLQGTSIKKDIYNFVKQGVRS
ncbi:hypothetical protein GLW04_19180 [Halobacillus litoralis]|uniref:Uncharacterized protein n=2 Tax=Halobacillus TaxID=45667 RepID=A0A845DWT4_9BACI|nr:MULTISPECIES: hypothetical protein [Halobacillus]MYL22000.1 hypothetical protein [Halobacillus litoralis]GEN52410.1 hypothetical protein HFA01_06720 [Halobacillus faecis]